MVYFHPNPLLLFLTSRAGTIFSVQILFLAIPLCCRVLWKSVSVAKCHNVITNQKNWGFRISARNCEMIRKIKYFSHTKIAFELTKFEFDKRKEMHKVYMANSDIFTQYRTDWYFWDACNERRKSKFKFNCFRRNVYQSHKELELSAESQEEAETWKASFLRAGVFPEKNKEEKTESVSYYVKSNWVAVFNNFLFSLRYHFLWIKYYLFVDQRRYRISRSPTRETDWNNQEFGWFISQNHPQESQRHGS